jgi:hypothetical protein
MPAGVKMFAPFFEKAFARACFILRDKQQHLCPHLSHHTASSSLDIDALCCCSAIS